MLNLSEFLSTVSLLTDTDAKDDGQPRITLMTIHAAKGLEFGAVLLQAWRTNSFQMPMLAIIRARWRKNAAYSM